MKTISHMTFGLFLSSLAFGQVPEPIITTMASASGHATIAGRLSSKPELPIGISVKNGNLSYSTLTDFEGRWGIVIRHQAVNVQVQSWDLKNGTDKSRSISQALPDEP